MKSSPIKTPSSTSKRSERNHSPLSTPPDEPSNHFISNKSSTNHLRQQSIQKAMKYLREKKTHKSSNKKLLKRLHSNATPHLSSTKTSRMKKTLLHSELLNPQTSTPLFKRHSSKNKLSFEPMTSPTRLSRRSDVQSNEEMISARSVNKRKHSTNSLSPISTTSSNLVKKRAKNGSPLNKSKSKKYSTDDEQFREEKHIKRKRNFDLSSNVSSLNILIKIFLLHLEYKNPPAFLNDSLPNTITDVDIELFLESRKTSAKLITDVRYFFSFISFSLTLFS